MWKLKPKQLIVLKDVQFKMIGIVFLNGIAATLLFLGLFYFLVDQMLGRIQNTQGLSFDQKIQIFFTWDQLILSFVFFSLAFTTFFTVYGIYFSNKVAGPIFNMMRTLDKYISGQSDVRIHVRKSDFFQELSQKINDALDSKVGKKAKDGPVEKQ